MPTVSHSWNASLPIRWVGTWPVMHTIGIESISASVSPVTALVAPGPGGHQHAADLAGRARIALGRVHRALLVAHQDVLDLVLLEQRVVDRQHRAARIAEQVLDALVGSASITISAPVISLVMVGSTRSCRFLENQKGPRGPFAHRHVRGWPSHPRRCAHLRLRVSLSNKIAHSSAHFGQRGLGLPPASSLIGGVLACRRFGRRELERFRLAMRRRDPGAPEILFRERSRALVVHRRSAPSRPRCHCAALRLDRLPGLRGRQSRCARVGARPVTEAIHQAGDWALRFLLITLAITPAQRILHIPASSWRGARSGSPARAMPSAPVALRPRPAFRPVQSGERDRPAHLSADRRAGIAGLIALASTSTDAAISGLGPGRWNALHRLVYAIALLADRAFLHAVQARDLPAGADGRISSSGCWLIAASTGATAR